MIDKDGRFLLGEAADADLQPRDVVARAVHVAGAQGRGAFLDCRAAIGAAFPEEFPAVFAACMRAGLDPRETPIPVAAAAHYHMGGIAAGPDGRTSLPGLFAVGECAATGVHGANRLASNSLLEGLVVGGRAGRQAADHARAAGAVMAKVDALQHESLERPVLQEAMTRWASVVRDGEGLRELAVALEDAPARPIRTTTNFEDAALMDSHERARALTFGVKADLVESLGADKYGYFSTSGAAARSAQLAELATESRIGENLFVARVSADSKAATGQTVELALDTTKLHVFDAETGVNLTA